MSYVYAVRYAEECVDAAAVWSSTLREAKATVRRLREREVISEKESVNDLGFFAHAPRILRVDIPKGIGARRMAEFLNSQCENAQPWGEEVTP